MTENHSDSVEIKKQNIPDSCPNCGHKNRGSVSCRRCGLYFFRYYENREPEKVEEREADSINSAVTYYDHILRKGEKNYIIYFILAIFALLITLKADILFDFNKNHKNCENASLDNIAVKVRQGKKYFREGMIRGHLTDIIGASGHFKKSFLIFSQVNNDRLSTLARMNLAICLRVLKKYPEALMHLDSVINYAVNIEDRRLEAKALREKGIVNYYFVQYESALLDLEGAYFIHMEINKEIVISDCILLGAVENKLNGDEASGYIERAIELSEDITDPLKRYNIRNHLLNIKKGGLMAFKITSIPLDFENM